MEHFEHNPGDHDDPVAGPTFLLGVVGAVLLLVILLGLTALFYNAYGEQEREVVIPREAWAIGQYRQEQRQLLKGPPREVTRTVFEEEVQAYIIPIEQAMELVVREGAP